MAHITARIFYNAFSTGRIARAVELGDIVEIDGRRGYVASIGRKYVNVRVYGGKLTKIDPLAVGPVWTGETHN